MWKLYYRIKYAWAVLKGTAIVTFPKKSEKKFRNFPYTEDEQDFLDSLKIEFLFSEFGEQRVNAGGADFQDKGTRLDPSLKSLRKYFPNAKYTVYSDFDLKIEGVNLIKVSSPVAHPEHPRYGYRTADYFKFLSLTESDADFKCVLDSDMEIVSSDIIALIHLTRKFSFCVPYNDRQLLRQDMIWSQDTQLIEDESLGFGHSYNQSPMTLWKDDERGKTFYKKWLRFLHSNSYVSLFFILIAFGVWFGDIKFGKLTEEVYALFFALMILSVVKNETIIIDNKAREDILWYLYVPLVSHFIYS